MSQSNVGESRIYEAGDQRNDPESVANQKERFKEGESNSHLAQDSKDERTIANKLAREEKRKEESESKDFETQLKHTDATLPAKMHGNEPSKGAKIDQEIADEEAEMLKKKGEFGHSSGKN